MSFADRCNRRGKLYSIKDELLSGKYDIPDDIKLYIESLIREIEKAIMASDVGITPNNDGSVIRLVFPDMTEERRRELVKQAKKMGEETKVAIRNHRREAMDIIKKMKNNKEMSEDEAAGCEADVEKMVSGYMGKLETIISAKEKELMTV